MLGLFSFICDTRACCHVDLVCLFVCKSHTCVGLWPFSSVGHATSIAVSWVSLSNHAYSGVLVLEPFVFVKKCWRRIHLHVIDDQHYDEAPWATLLQYCLHVDNPQALLCKGSVIVMLCRLLSHGRHHMSAMAPQITGNSNAYSTLIHTTKIHQHFASRTLREGSKRHHKGLVMQWF